MVIKLRREYIKGYKKMVRFGNHGLPIEEMRAISEFYPRVGFGAGFIVGADNGKGVKEERTENGLDKEQRDCLIFVWTTPVHFHSWNKRMSTAF